ncbi:hypothetical protein SEA_MORKIE_59 [Gordonia phage Morkie]|nr:hypothetical protein SEA_MORKIE_59 [Gordonia phage Morkie]
MSSDPAEIAADKALDAVADDKRMFLDDWDVLTDTAIAAAREALEPLREIHKPRTRHIEAWGAETKCGSCLVFWPCPSARLLYSDAELAAHPEPIVAEEIQ